MKEKYSLKSYPKNWHTADNWFCWDAEPRKTEEENHD